MRQVQVLSTKNPRWSFPPTYTLALLVFTVKIFFLDLPGYIQNMAKWLNLWADVNERIKQSQMEQEEGG